MLKLIDVKLASRLPKACSPRSLILTVKELALGADDPCAIARFMKADGPT